MAHTRTLYVNNACMHYACTMLLHYYCSYLIILMQNALSPSWYFFLLPLSAVYTHLLVRMVRIWTPLSDAVSLALFHNLFAASMSSTTPLTTSFSPLSLFSSVDLPPSPPGGTSSCTLHPPSFFWAIGGRPSGQVSLSVLAARLPAVQTYEQTQLASVMSRICTLFQTLEESIMLPVLMYRYVLHHLYFASVHM